MCSPEAARFAEEVVAEFMGANRLFTAKDVTDSIKERLAHAQLPWERHTALKGAVHAVCERAMAGPSWDRSLIQIPGVRDPAYLYHPAGADPQDYFNAVPARGSLPASQPGIVNTPAGIASAFGPTGGTPDPGERSVTGRGRLNVSPSFLRSIGLSNGTRAHLYLDGASLVLSGTPPSQPVPSSSIQVDSQGRVRLNRKTRIRLGATDAQKYVLTTDRSSVRVTPA